jgi:hypothetical protein
LIADKNDPGPHLDVVARKDVNPWWNISHNVPEFYNEKKNFRKRKKKIGFVCEKEEGRNEEREREAPIRLFTQH